MKNVSAEREPGLVSRTHLDAIKILDKTRPAGAHLVVKFRSYPSGHAELTGTKVLEPMTRRSASPVDDIDPQRRKETNYCRSVRRSKKTVRVKSLTMQADRLFTLTYRANKTDREACFKDFVRFTRLMRDRFGDWQYVAVAERQKRGAWHFHIASNKFYHIQTVNKLWQRVVGLNNGNVDVEFRHRVSPTKIAAYLSKYITKGFSLTAEDEATPGRNRYRVSLGITDPVETGYLALCPGSEFRLLANIFQELSNGPLTNIYENMYCWWISNFDLSLQEAKLCH